ncbi:hypothetical protein BN1723_014451 [Verticillium longisporum]|uniref:Major facilitator superfamily (MFS) profile domain-containing protein n=1 Tax=Verticillium longisporum TaxID=100787 RepID=A0A0G4MAD6_VERLO|nr:hypothetical protein BN1723_014451 [Verticillium longisporum]
MGLAQKETPEATEVAGSGLASVLPVDAKPWYRTPHLIKLNLLIMIPLISSASIGYDGSMMNGLQSLPQWRKYFGNPEGATLGAMNSVYPAGKVVALFLVTWICDRFVMQAVSQNMHTFIVARAVLGFFTSFLAQPSPILIAELAYPTHRGKLTALYQTSFVSFPSTPTGNDHAADQKQYLGGIIAAWCTYGTLRIDSTWSWRLPSLLQGALPAIQLLGIWFLPESPRWLIARGRSQEARKILADFHAGGDLNSRLVNFEMQEIEAVVTQEADVMSQNSWMELIRTPANRKRTLIAAIVGWFAQWNGVNILSYYLALVLNTIGITDSKTQTLINGLLNISNWLSAVFVGAMMVDRIGRRTLFLVSTGGMLVSYIIWTGLSSYFISSQSAEAGRAAVAFIFITFFFYAMAWSPLLAAYTVEIFPYTLRSRGLSVMYVSTFTGLIVGNQVNPIAMKAIGWRYYIVFCCILAVLLAVIWLLFPETKGHTLEEIRELFEGRSSSQDKLNDAEHGRMDEKSNSDDHIMQVEMARQGR